MFILYADKNRLTVRQRETVTSGSVDVYPVRFEFSEDWDGLSRTAVFHGGGESRSVLLDGGGETTIPWEVLEVPGRRLLAGVRGTRGGTEVLPTLWADLGPIWEGADTGQPGQPPTPDLWEQRLESRGSALRRDGQNLSLMSGDRTLSTVQLPKGEISVPYTFGHGLKQEGNVVAVDAVSDFSGDNTLPITAAAVQLAVGNIEVLLETI